MKESDTKQIGRYLIKENIGVGTYGKVNDGIDTMDNSEVAVKEILSISDEVDLKRILREIKILNKCNHENIVKLKDVIVEKEFQTKQRVKQTWLQTVSRLLET